LIQAGADINAREADGMTALMIAAFHGHLEAVRSLIEAGADLSFEDSYGFTALDNAESQGHKAVARYLMDRGAVRSGRGQSRKLTEASANFDSDHVAPFLGEVASLLDGGFSSADAEALAAEVAGLDVDASLAREFRVVHRGRQSVLRIEAFMDDVDAPDLALFAPRELARRISRIIQRRLE
jgi:hypothetical protein